LARGSGVSLIFPYYKDESGETSGVKSAFDHILVPQDVNSAKLPTGLIQNKKKSDSPFVQPAEESAHWTRLSAPKTFEGVILRA